MQQIKTTINSTTNLLFTKKQKKPPVSLQLASHIVTTALCPGSTALGSKSGADDETDSKAKRGFFVLFCFVFLFSPKKVATASAAITNMFQVSRPQYVTVCDRPELYSAIISF